MISPIWGREFLNHHADPGTPSHSPYSCTRFIKTAKAKQMTSFHYLINLSETVDFFDWDEVAKQYQTPKALTQAVVTNAAICSPDDVESAFVNLHSRITELFDTLQANLGFQTNPSMQNKFGVSLLRTMMILSGLNSAVPQLNLNESYPLDPRITNFVNEFIQREVENSGYVQTLENDIEAGVDPFARYQDKTVYNFDKGGHLSTGQLFRDDWVEFEENLGELELEANEEIIERMVDLISREPSPAAEWLFDWLRLVSSYPEPDNIEEMSPRLLQMVIIARMRPDLEAALEESEYTDIQRTCEEISFQYNNWTKQLRQSPELSEDAKTKAVYGAMTSLVMAFALTNEECREIIQRKTHLRKVGYL